MDRQGAIHRAILLLKPDQFDPAGYPLVRAMNGLLAFAGGFKITANERNEFWDNLKDEAEGAGAMLAEDAVREDEETYSMDPPDELHTIVLESAMSEPLILFSHGHGTFTMRPGGVYKLPAEALAMLRDTDATFTEV